MVGSGVAKSLPIAKDSDGRRSRVGWWRAGVLLLVHLLIAVHIAHWLSTGSSLSPLEPSESIEFSTRGIVNAGLIFFVLTIGSTLVFGRWFCGWACHHPTRDRLPSLSFAMDSDPISKLHVARVPVWAR